MRIVVLSDNTLHPVSIKLRDVLRAKVDCEGGPQMALLDQAEEVLPRAAAEMTFVVLSPDPERALALLRRLRPLADGSVLAVGQASESKLILRALHEGADHYLDEAELETHLEAVLARLHRREEVASGEAVGRLISILGASGGSGTSTLAVNLAAVLARESQRCALIDLKPGVGDLAALLDVKPTHTLADLCINARRMDRSMFESALVAHPSGIHLLAPPQVYEDIRLVTPTGVQQTLSLARQLFPYAVADLEDCFHEEQMVALRQSEIVLLVFRLDFTSLRNTCRILEYLEQVEGVRERVRLVINRYGQAKELPASEAEEALGLKVSHFIPEDARTINGANNTGVPAVLKTPSTKVAQSIVQLAQTLRPAPPAAPPIKSPSRNGTAWLPSFHG
jgi:pilus assembly protein CpaE